MRWNSNHITCTLSTHSTSDQLLEKEEFSTKHFQQFLQKKKMAQATVDERNIALSKHTQIKVTDNGQIEFTITPSKHFMPRTFVYLSGPAWVSLSSNGRKKINELLSAGAEDTWMYHPNTKYITVTTTSQVFVLTYNRKGNIMKEHSVYLTPEEWGNLDLKVPDINKQLDAVIQMRQKSTNPLNKYMMTQYSWKFQDKENPKKVHEGFVHYLDKKTALRAAEKFKISSGEQNLGDVELVTHVKKPLDPFQFMLEVFVSVWYKVTAKVRVILNKPELTTKKCLEMNYDEIEEVVQSKMMIQIFNRCWERMNLPNTEPATFLNYIDHIYCEMDLEPVMGDKVNYVGNRWNRDSIPCLINAVWVELLLDEKVAPLIRKAFELDETSDEEEDEEDQLAKTNKKLKIAVESDAE